ncbi:hypothetical protein DICVIV_05790 [Dictyocaulus viviparus]|uniref:Uncharacterized protein n=1 Tax=Dictyocaulus viviparus TaxID=29172 RepID=A0A0D8XWC8_DICVI|nr:hypothetical protein DICVIV_05790 [Dictyocaulus viviparus]
MQIMTRFSGLYTGVYELQALACFESLGKQGGKSYEKCIDACASAPFLHMGFMENYPKSSFKPVTDLGTELIYNEPDLFYKRIESSIVVCWCC